MKPQLVFVHGWAFGPSFWDGLRASLHDLPSQALDLGYFGPEDTAFRRNGRDPVVAVGHSLGFQWLLGDAPFPLDALVSLGGFARFDVPPGPVRAMRRGLGRDAAQVVQSFHQACALPHELAPDIASARTDRLAEGLDRLLTLDRHESLASLTIPLLAVAAEDDLIAPPALSRAQFPAPVMLACGGHAFPASRPDQCALLIRDFLETL